MSDLLYWDPSIIVLPLGEGRLRLFHAVNRRNMVTSLAMISLIDQLTEGRTTEQLRGDYEKIGSSLHVADATAYTLWDHVFHNADFFDAETDPDDLRHQPFVEFLELMTGAGFLSSTRKPELDYEKRSFGDRYRGNYHEQIGTECLFNRQEATTWWTDQKFEPDKQTLRPTPYKFIEERFLESYFEASLTGKTVLEIGCGTGQFTAQMAQFAAHAVGMDINPNYIDTARKNWIDEGPGNIEFQVGDISAAGGAVAEFANSSFDYVAMIDLLLFMFDDKYQEQLFTGRIEVMQKIRQLLRPNGRLLIMDPHPFWLTPWFGAENLPFGIIAEYRQRWFKVSPTLEEISSLLFDSGFRIRRIFEPDVDAAYTREDAQGHAFMKQFPQWWFFEAEVAE